MTMKRLLSLFTVSFLLLAIGISAMAAQSASLSPLSSGRWVKIRVDSAGIHQMTHASLVSLGFPDPERVRVYGYGAVTLNDHDLTAAPLGLPEVASVHAAGKLLFYAEAEVHLSFTPPSTAGSFRSLDRVRNPYALAGYYFLSDETPRCGSEAYLVEAPAADAASSRRHDSHRCYQFIEHEDYLGADGGTFFTSAPLGDDMVSGPCTVSVVDAAEPRLLVEISSAVRNPMSGKDNYLKVCFDNPDVVALESAAVSALRCQSDYECFRPAFCAVNASLPSVADTSYSFTAIPSTAAKGSDFEFAAIDYVSASYSRRNRLGDFPALDMVLFDVARGDRVALADAPAGTMVWDVADMHRVVAYIPDAGGSFSIDRDLAALRLIAFDPERTQRVPEVVNGDLPPQDLASMECPDMVIVTTELFAGAAERLADIHRCYQGLDVAVVDQQLIFNEFSSGTPHVMAVRRFLRSLADKAPGRLRGVLLYGAASARQASRITPEGVYVITSENEDPGDGTGLATASPDFCGNFDRTRNFATDTYFVRLSDSAGNPSFASPYFRVLSTPMSAVVGRVPVTSLADAMAYNAKAQRYLQNPPLVGAPVNTLFVSGYATRSQDMHLADSEVMAAAAINAAGPELTVTRAPHNMFTSVTGLIGSSLRRGVGLMTYFGHGSNAGLTGVWTSVNAASASYSHVFPSAFFASCHVAVYDLETTGFFTNMLFKEDGGVISLVTAGREVYQNLNVELARIYGGEYFAMADGDPIGTAFVRAHNAMASAGKTLMCNSLAYNFFGDPMLPHYGISRRLLPASVNGTADGAVTPGAINVFCGTVTDLSGVADSCFNGVVKVTVYECPYTAVNRAPALSSGVSPSTVTEMELEQEPLAELVGTIEGGLFRAEGIVPHGSRAGSAVRVAFYGYSDDRTVRAAGVLPSVALDESTVDSLPSYQPPSVISFGVVDEPESGAITAGRLVTVRALIHAPAGLACGRAFGSAVRLERNGEACRYADAAVVAVAPGEYMLSYTFSDLPDGRHDLVLTVTDACMNQASASATFCVVTALKCGLSIERGESYRFLTDGPSASVMVEDHTGRLVRTLTASADGLVEWDLRDADGADVEPGHYRAFARMVVGPEVRSSDYVDFVVP